MSWLMLRTIDDIQKYLLTNEKSMIFYVNDRISKHNNMYLVIVIDGPNIVYWYDSDDDRNICHITGIFRNHRYCKNVYDCPEEVRTTKEDLLIKIEQFINAYNIRDLKDRR